MKTIKIAAILTILLIAFASKSVILAFVLPLFQAPDEQTHFSTVQIYSENASKTSGRNTEEPANKPDDIRTFNFSEEIKESAILSKFDEIKHQPENTLTFSNTPFGPNEEIIHDNEWNRLPDLSKTFRTSSQYPLYYLIGAQIDQLLTEHDILFRIAGIRLSSVFFGIGTVLMAFLAMRIIGFSLSSSFLGSSFLAFQPMFSFLASVINVDILLIFSFSFFAYAAFSLLQSGISAWRITLLTLSVFIGVLSKGPGAILLVLSLPLILFVIIERFHFSLRVYGWTVFIAFSILIASVSLLSPSYLRGIIHINPTTKRAIRINSCFMPLIFIQNAKYVILNTS